MIDCVHATEVIGKATVQDAQGKRVQQDVIGYRCALICEFLGWRHVVAEAVCQACLADPFAPRTLGARAAQGVCRRMLNVRVASLANWDKTPQMKGKYRDNLETAVQRCKAVNGEAKAAEALVAAVRADKLSVAEAEHLALSAGLKLE